MAGNWYGELMTLPGRLVGDALFGDGGADVVKDASNIDDQVAKENKSRAVLDRAKDAKANAPYAQAGLDGLNAQRDLLGLNGPEAEQAAMQRLMASPQFQQMVDTSEEAILANASATGGLRGGNVQQSLAQNRPAILSQLIDQQYNRFGGLAAAGQQGSQFTSGLGFNQSQAAAQANTQAGNARSGGLLGAEAARQQQQQRQWQMAMQTAGVASSLATGIPGGLGGGPPQQMPMGSNYNSGGLTDSSPVGYF